VRTRYLFSSLPATAIAWILCGSILIGQEEGDGGDGGRPERCGSECYETGRDARDACREADGDFWECHQAYRDALRDCLEEADCDNGWGGWGDWGDWGNRDGDERPEPCGLECFSTAREAASACREDGGSFWECIGAFRDSVQACREDAGCEVRQRPEFCGAECFESGRDAFRACRDEDDGSIGECARAFLEAVGTCREEAGCGQADDGEEAEEDEAIEELVAAAIEFTRGDVNDDGSTDISDAVNVLSYLFHAGPAPQCMDAADANDDGFVDVSDPTTILISLFRASGPLPGPGPAAGIDPTPDALGCGEF